MDKIYVLLTLAVLYTLATAFFSLMFIIVVGI